jgi:hypothetical protein
MMYHFNRNKIEIMENKLVGRVIDARLKSFMI